MVNAQNTLAIQVVAVNASEGWVPNGNQMYFIFPKTGPGNLECRIATYPLASGDVLTLGSAAKARISAAKDSKLEFRFFALQAESLYPLFTSQELMEVSTVMADFRGVKRFPASSALAQKCHRLIDQAPTEVNLEHRSHLLRVASAILAEEFARRQNARFNSTNLQQRMDQIFEKVSEDEILTLTSEKLAEKFGCSQRHLNRLFHIRFGLSVGALRLEIRLLRVLSLLRNTNEKIINVAGQCDFNHLGLFNTYFKRRFGCSPSQWRRAVAGQQKEYTAPKKGLRSCRLQQLGLCPLDGQSSRPHTPVEKAPTGNDARLVIRAFCSPSGCSDGSVDNFDRQPAKTLSIASLIASK